MYDVTYLRYYRVNKFKGLSIVKIQHSRTHTHTWRRTQKKPWFYVTFFSGVKLSSQINLPLHFVYAIVMLTCAEVI